MGKEPYRAPDSISGKWTDLNAKCQLFQSHYQRAKDNRPSGANDEDIIKQALDEYRLVRASSFPHFKVWDLLHRSPKFASVPQPKTGRRRPTKRTKTSSSVDPDTPTSDARNIDLNNINVLDGEEEEEPEPVRPAGRRAGRKGKAPESSSGVGTEEFEELNRRLMDIRDIGAQRLELQKRKEEKSEKALKLMEERQMDRDIEYYSRPYDHLSGLELQLLVFKRTTILIWYQSKD